MAQISRSDQPPQFGIRRPQNRSATTIRNAAKSDRTERNQRTPNRFVVPGRMTSGGWKGPPYKIRPRRGPSVGSNERTPALHDHAAKPVF
jgi:hypothetical protein